MLRMDRQWGTVRGGPGAKGGRRGKEDARRSLSDTFPPGLDRRPPNGVWSCVRSHSSWGSTVDKWPQAVVASFVLILVGAISITAIVKYATVDDALKFWSALSGIVGIVTGAMVTYFFSRGATQSAQQAAESANTRANSDHEAAKSNAAEASVAKAQLATTHQALAITAGHMDTETWTKLQESNPTVRQALGLV